MQSRRQSLYETLVGVVVGFLLSTLLLACLSYRDNLQISLWKNLEWTAYFTILSIARGYCLRRFFNRMHKK